jgi:hypothetical protein
VAETPGTTTVVLRRDRHVVGIDRRHVRRAHQRVEAEDVGQRERQALEDADRRISRRQAEDLILRRQVLLAGAVRALRELVDLRQAAVEDVAADADREMTEAAEHAALADRRVAAGEREAELRRHELIEVIRLLAGVLSDLGRVRNHDARHRGRAARRTHRRREAAALRRRRSRQHGDRGAGHYETFLHSTSS